MKPLAIIFNDIHLGEGNEKDVYTSVKQVIDYAQDNNILDIIFAGDWFHLRSFQRQSWLTATDKLLDEFHEAGLILHLFPGNHDKTVYASRDSFLDSYKHYPAVRFYREISEIKINEVSITLLPFFSDELLVPMIKDAPGGDVLISHFEMQGSTHLGKVSEKQNITRKMLKKWNKTYLGHFHNTHEINKDIIHLPSLRQSNFGEDNNKGFTILYDDLSYEIIRGVFKEFQKVCIDLDKTSLPELKILIKTYQNSDNVVRFELTGEKSKLDSLGKELFKGTGIDVKKKYDKVFELDEAEKPIVIQSYSRADIEKSFTSFCDDKGYDEEAGLTYIDKFFKDK